jgi:hypothetical protein
MPHCKAQRLIAIEFRRARQLLEDPAVAGRMGRKPRGDENAITATPRVAVEQHQELPPRVHVSGFERTC